MNIIKEGVGKNGSEQFKPYFKILTAMLSLKDSITIWRIDSALCSHLQIIENNTYRRDSTDKYVKFMVKLANKNEEVKVWLFKHRDTLNDVLGEIGYRLM